MKPSERRSIQRHADAGDESAQQYLKLLAACEQVITGADGMSLARGMMGEHDDTYGQAIDEATATLMRVLMEAATQQTGSKETALESLIWMVSDVTVTEKGQQALEGE